MYLGPKLQDVIDRSIDNGLDQIIGLDQQERLIVASVISNAIQEGLAAEKEKMQLSEKAGPPMWDTLHWIAKVADTEQKPELYLRLLEIYMRGHPCKDVCRPHIQTNLRNLDPRKFKSMFEHSVKLHNLINKQLGKQQYPLLQARKDFDLDCDSCIFDPHTKSHNAQTGSAKIIRKRN
jgi:hypothetical protein